MNEKFNDYLFVFHATEKNKNSINDKLKILNFHGMSVDSALSKILFKSEERRKELEKKLNAEIPDNSELLSIINLEDEILDLNYYL